MEFKLIRQLATQQQVHRNDVSVGIGDDAACLQPPANHELIVSTDTLVNGVHFPESTSAEAIGFKSLAVNLSDIAAMGATPAWATLALTLPEADQSWLSRFMAGFYELAKQYDVQVVGGDTTQGPLSITVTIMGLAPTGSALKRDNAKSGDYLCVSGYLGQAGYELTHLQGENKAVNRLNYPMPRIELGQKLRAIAHSAIDISDGLIVDLGHLLEASRVGAEIKLESLPLAPDLSPTGQLYELALTAGDDYELCFTVPEARMTELQAIQQSTAVPITAIGRIQDEPGLRIQRDNGQPLVIDPQGYQHFTR